VTSRDDNLEVGSVEIIEYDQSWQEAFRDVASRLRSILGESATRIDHIGSTSVAGLASKDVIDIQVSVEQNSDLDGVAGELEKAGWTPMPHINRDHDVPGSADEPAQRKRFLNEPPGSRRVNLLVRVMGHPNQRYPILFRDYLRAHPLSAQVYATLKKDLALLLPNDSGRYADVKDAACDLIYFAAEDWARATGWDAGQSDA
jgi:dephospho-CoA kinase